MSTSADSPEREQASARVAEPEVSGRTGITKRMLGILTLVVMVPLITVFVGWQVIQAEEGNKRPFVRFDTRVTPSTQPTQTPQMTAGQPADPLPRRFNQAKTQFYSVGQTQPMIVTRQLYPVQSSFAASEQKSRELAAKLQQARAQDDETQQASLLKELKAHLMTEFASRHNLQAKELASAQERIDVLRKTHEKREALQNEIVQRRLNELLGQPDVLQWNSPTSAAQRRLIQTPRPDVAGPGPGVLPRTSRSYPTGPPLPGSAPVASTRIAGTPIGSPAPPRIPDSYRDTGTRISVVNTGGSDVFGIARRLMDSKLQLKSAKLRHQELKRLAEKGMASNTELSQAELKLQSSTAEAGFAAAELAAIKSHLDRETEFATAQLKRSLEIAESARTQFKSGIASSDSVLKAESALAESEKARATVDALQQQLKQALELIDKANRAADEANVDGDEASTDGDDASDSDSEQKDPLEYDSDL